MQEHLKVVAWLQIASGVMILAIALFVGSILSFVGLASGEREAAALLGGLGGVLSIVIGAFSVPYFLGGWGLLNRRSWARILVLVLSVLNLFNFPVGTLIGGYSMWVLLNDETRRLLESEPTYAEVPPYS